MTKFTVNDVLNTAGTIAAVKMLEGCPNYMRELPVLHGALVSAIPKSQATETPGNRKEPTSAADMVVSIVEHFEIFDGNNSDYANHRGTFAMWLHYVDQLNELRPRDKTSCPTDDSY